MRLMKMTETGGGNALSVDIDDDLNAEIGSGGYGAIFPVRGNPKAVVKKLNVHPPKTVAEIGRYTAHIRVTKNRLQQILDEESRRDRSTQRRFIIDYITEILDWWLYCDKSGVPFGHRRRRPQQNRQRYV